MAVAVEVYGRNMEVTDRIIKYMDKKVSNLDRFLPGIEEARVDVEYVKSARNASDRQVAQLTIRGKGFILRSEESAEDIFAALDSVLDKMQRQIERYKGKHYRGRGDGKSAAEAVQSEAVETPEDEEGLPKIVKRKKFNLIPMDELEAIEQMQLLGHDNFFVFLNINNRAINILYRRKNGTYGIIIPEVS